MLVVLGFSASAASSRNQAVQVTRAFHGTKDCSGFTGLAGGFCTFRSSNVKAIKVGSKIFYFQVAGKSYASVAEQPFAEYRTANAGYFETLRIPVIAGRNFAPTDRDSTTQVVVVNLLCDAFPAQVIFGFRGQSGLHIGRLLEECVAFFVGAVFQLTDLLVVEFFDSKTFG